LRRLFAEIRANALSESGRDTQWGKAEQKEQVGKAAEEWHFTLRERLR
jgi:hypothetical protein